MSWKKSSSTDSNYVLPVASSTTLGGVKIGSGLSINSGTISSTGGSGGGLPIRGLLSDYVPLDGNYVGYFDSNLQDGIYIILKGNQPLEHNPPFVDEDYVLIHRKMPKDGLNWAFQESYAFARPEIRFSRRVLQGSLKGDGRQQKWQYTGGDEALASSSTKRTLTLGDSIYAKWAGDPVDATSSTPSLIPFQPQDNTDYPGQTMYHVGLQAEIFKRTRMDIYTLARGGARMARTRSAVQWDNYSFHNLATTLDFTGYDYLLVGYGTNDCGNQLPVGTVDSVDDTTTGGAMNLGIEAILANNPNIQIFFTSPIARFDSGGGRWASTDGSEQYASLKPYIDVIHAVADKWNIPCFDGYNMSGINKYNYTKYLNTDKLHVDDYSVWGARTSSWLKQYI